MRTILILAVGVWIGREIYTTHANNKAKEREEQIRKALEKFIGEKLPTLPTADMQKEVDTILGQRSL